MKKLRGPLESFRILDLTQTVSGLYAGMMLADQGAEVLKIDAPVAGVRGVTTLVTSSRTDDVDYRLLHLNRNKKSLTLNLKSDQGKNIFLDLVRVSDAVIDNFRPEVLDRMGLGYERLRQVNRGIVSCSISAFGTKGPYRNRPGANLVMEGIAGLLSLAGEPGKPVVPGVWNADTSSAMYATQGILAALLCRQKTGEGQKVEVSMVDSCLSMLQYPGSHFLNTGVAPRTALTKSKLFPLLGLFRTADRHITLASLTEQNWRSLCKVLGRDELASDERFTSAVKRLENMEAINAIVEEALQSRPAAEWLAALTAAEIPAGPVNDFEAVFADPHIAEYGAIATTTYRGKAYKVIGNPLKMSGFEQQEYETSEPGQDTAEVLLQLLSYSKEQVDGLRATGVV